MGRERGGRRSRDVGNLIGAVEGGEAPTAPGGQNEEKFLLHVAQLFDYANLLGGGDKLHIHLLAEFGRIVWIRALRR